MAMGGQMKKIITEIVIAFVVIMLLVVLRPLFIGQVYEASQPYNITASNGAVQTVTPSATLSYTQTDTVYSIVIFLVALVALIVILLTAAGKL
jgi:hypothetical protein